MMKQTVGHKMEQPVVIFKCLFRRIAHIFIILTLVMLFASHYNICNINNIWALWKHILILNFLIGKNINFLVWNKMQRLTWWWNWDIKWNNHLLFLSVYLGKLPICFIILTLAMLYASHCNVYNIYNIWALWKYVLILNYLVCFCCYFIINIS